MDEVGGGLKKWEELSPGLPKCKLGVPTTHMNFGSLNKTHVVIVFLIQPEKYFRCAYKKVNIFNFLTAYTMVCGSFVDNC
jgi:hypothetical protein